MNVPQLLTHLAVEVGAPYWQVVDLERAPPRVNLGLRRVLSVQIR
jgi:hypothetical protein